MHHVFPGFLTPVLTQLFFPKPPTSFLTCFCRGERRKYARKKSRLNGGSNSKPPGHESDTLTTEPPGRGSLQRGLGIFILKIQSMNHEDFKKIFKEKWRNEIACYLQFLLFPQSIFYGINKFCPFLPRLKLLCAKYLNI